MRSPVWQISPLTRQDIPLLEALQPPDWNDIRLVFSRHLGYEYFFAYVIKREDGLPVGVGEVIRFGTTAWLGNIIVHPDYQRQGLGQTLTKYGINHANSLGITQIWLLATAQGAPVYRRLGFLDQGRYLFIKTGIPLEQAGSNKLRRIKKQDHPQVFNLDQLASGEDRSQMLSPFLSDGMVTTSTENKSITGFYLPRLGDGLTIATNTEDGLALLTRRQSSGKSYLVIPEANVWLCHYLSHRQYTVFRTAQLMVLGAEKKPWRPEMIFNRIGGYAG